MTPPPVHPFLLEVLGNPDGAAPVACAPEVGDWDGLVGDAVANGLAPLLHRWLRRTDLARRLPPGPGSRLEAHVFGVAARNLVLASELGAILRAAEAARLAVGPLRGAMLAEHLYGDVTVRPMGDVDLLVRREDLAVVTALLRDRGFRELDRSPGFARAFSYTLEFFKDRHGWIVVEPHWTIAYPPFVDRVDMVEVWRRAVRTQVAGVETWSLGPEALLLHLCLHVTHRDGTAPLLWLYDIDRLLRSPALRDWGWLLSLAREAALEWPLARVLGEVTSRFASPVPAGLLDQLRAAPPRSREDRVARALAGGRAVDGKESLAALLTMRGWRARLRYARALLFPSADFMRIHYSLTGPGQLGFAYLRRFWSLSLGGVRGLLHLLTAS